MGTWLSILTKEEFDDPNYSVKEDRFQIDSNEAVCWHLQSMYVKHVKLTGKIIHGGEEFFHGKEIEYLIQLLNEEKEKLKMIFLEEWEFQMDPKIDKEVNKEKYNFRNFDPTKAWLAEKTIESSEYEIRYGKIGDLELRVTKNWMKVSKIEIQQHIEEFLRIIQQAKDRNEYLLFTYY